MWESLGRGEEAASWASLMDTVPHLPYQYETCRDAVYGEARAMLIEAASLETPTAVTVLGMVGIHGVGKTVLAMEIAQDEDVTMRFADGVAWIQLGEALNDEELADQIVKLVETVLSTKFKDRVKDCNTLNTVVERARRVLADFNCLVVIDDVAGVRGRRALQILVSLLGTSCVVLFTAPTACVGDDVVLGDAVAVMKTVELRPFDVGGQESLGVFRKWVKSSHESKEAMVHANEEKSIVNNCHGLPMCLAMAGGFMSKFNDSWALLAATLEGSNHGEDTISRIMGLLLKKGGQKLEAQLKAVASLPVGVWVSLTALADLWGMDYQLIRASARRLGKLAFAEYRLGDSTDEGQVKFHWAILKYCHGLATVEDILDANRRIMTNIRRRKKMYGSSNKRDRDGTAWWGNCQNDKYTCRRLHWHVARADTVPRLRELVGDYQWVSERLHRDGLLGVHLEFKLAMSTEEQADQRDEAFGMHRVFLAINEAMKLEIGTSDMPGALPAFLVSRLAPFEMSTSFCKEFLLSIHEKAKRPWLRPIPTETPEWISQPISMDSFERDAVTYQANCLAANASGKVVCGDKHGNIHVFDPANGKTLIEWPASDIVGHPQAKGVGALATLGDYIISGHFNGCLYLRSIRSGRFELLNESDTTLDKITAIDASECGSVAVGTHTGELFVLKTIRGFQGSVRRIDLEGHCDVVSALHVFDDGRRIASSSVDGFAAVWIARSSGSTRISLNGHKPDVGHKENYITTFASVADGKRLLSSCRGGAVSVWNTSNGVCLETLRLGFEFSRGVSLKHCAPLFFSPHTLRGVEAPEKIELHVGYPYLVTRSEHPDDFLIIATGNEMEGLGIATVENGVSTWLELWHPSTHSVYIAAAYEDGSFGSFQLVTSLI